MNIETQIETKCFHFPECSTLKHELSSRTVEHFPELCADRVELVPPREQLRVGVPLDLAVVKEGAASQEAAVEYRRVDHVHSLSNNSIFRLFPSEDLPELKHALL